jgi:DNA-binding NtrC family response regulator
MSSLIPEKPVLLIDDETYFLRSLTRILWLHAGVTNTFECGDSREVQKLLAERTFSLIICDLNMPHISGEALLEAINRDYPELPVIILTGMDQVDQAVRCMKAGAFDYFVKPAEAERLAATVLRALQTAELQQTCARLKKSLLSAELERPEIFAPIVAGDAKMQAIFKYLEAIASSPEPVLITGESGTGKELIAKAVHSLAPRDSPWVAVNVAGVDDTVFSDTLFGHLRGAFTGAKDFRAGMIDQAQGGVLFLDEIGDLAPESQVKLLRFLQSGEYFPLGSDRPKQANVRVLVATNQDLKQLQIQGKFRKDLFYRLNTHHVHLPPLRERKESIPLLLEHFLSEAAAKLGKKKPTPPPELTTLLSLYDFPGNIRELRSLVFNAVSLHQSKKLSMASFREATGIELATGAAQGGVTAAPAQPRCEAAPLLSFHDKLPNLKLAADLLVTEALRRTQGNQALAARLLGISPPSLSARLKKLRS